MKLILVLLFTTFFAFSQRDTTFPLVSKKPSQRITEAGSITFTKTMYTLQFDRYTNQEYRDKITRFMKTKRRNYTNLGTYTLHLVQRKGNLYILEQRFPERLVLLD